MFERPPGIAAAHDIDLLAEDEPLGSHVVPVALFEHPRGGDGARADGRAVHLVGGGVGVLPMEVALGIGHVVLPPAAQVVGLRACHHGAGGVQQVVGVLLELVAGI